MTHLYLRQGSNRALPRSLAVWAFFFLVFPAFLLRAQVLQHRYSFSNNVVDSVGGAVWNGTLVGNASVTSSNLSLPGGGSSGNPSGYVSLPNGIVTNDTSITVECWLTDTAGGAWAEAWCFGDSAAGPGKAPTSGTAYISLIPHSGPGDFRAAFNQTGGNEVDVISQAGPMPLNSEQYAVVTYNVATSNALLYLNGVQVGSAIVPTNLAPSNYGVTFNNWLSRDEFGADPMFAGSIDELRIWNAAVSPLYVAVSSTAGPNIVVNNLTPSLVNVLVSITNLLGGAGQQANVTANFSQASNVPLTTLATNWSSSNPGVLTVTSSGAITAVSAGNATVSATIAGVTGTSTLITVASNSAPSTITVGYWQFNNSGNLGFDSSSFSNNLKTASGTPTFTNGLFGGALYLDGASTMNTLSGAFPVGVPTNNLPYTIAVWEKVDAGCPNNGGFVGWGVNATSDANDFRLNGPNSLDDYWFNNDFIAAGTPADPMDGNWHAVMVTWDGTNETMYMDATNVGSRVPAQAPNVQPTAFIVGKTTSDVNFRGWLEDLLICNVPLTPAQMSVYQSGNWSASPFTIPLQPVASPSNTVFAGTTVTLTVPVAGTPPFQYQWQKGGANLSGATNASLILSNASVSDSGNYSVIVGNGDGTNTSPTLTVTVNPPSSPTFVVQPTPAFSTNYIGGLVTFSAVVQGTQPIRLQWQFNGTNILNANTSSLTLAGLQTNEAGNYTLVASNALGFTNSLPAFLSVLPPPNPTAMNVLTYHNDNTRDGADTNEVLLTLGNVNTSTFGKLITYPTDGLIIAQPLYVAGLAIPGQGTHNTVIVATENNTVYAFDADSNAGTNGGLLWQTNLGIAVSSFNDLFGNRGTGSFYPDIDPVVGITGTPAIDPNSGTLYVNVHSSVVSGGKTNFFHTIHALNITNGTEQSYSPVIVSNAVPGTGIDNTNGIVTFNPLQENQRPGMTLAGGMVYAAYGSYADTDPYHGWVFGFNATNLAQSASNAFNTTPNATKAQFGVNAAEGALWMSGDGLCVDVSNNLYFVSGNGSFSANTNGGDYSDSFVKLSTTNGLKVADYFTPFNQSTLATDDTDLGSGGSILLPDSVGSVAHPHLMIGCGKDGILRLVDRDNMGKFNSGNDNQIVQEVQGAISGAWSTPAYFNNQIYYQGSGGGVMRSFLITNGVINPAPASQTSVTFSAFATGGTPSISANGTNNGIVWNIQSDAAGSAGAAILHAFNATNLAQELYNSSQNLARDNPGPAIIMTTPTVANGKVFVGTSFELSIFGNSLFLATPQISPAGGSFTNSQLVTISDVTPNSTIYYTLDGTAPTTNSLIYSGPIVLTSNARVQAMAAQRGAANSGVASASFIDTSAVGTGIGLQGAYWANTTGVAFTNPAFSASPTFTRTDPTVNFNWSTTPPSVSIGLSNFVVRWTGAVQPEYNETYTFTTATANGVRLFVNGQLLINHWTNQPFTAWSNTITLAAQQRYNIEMDFFNQSAGAMAQLSWSSPSTANAIIPQTQLYPVTNPPPSVIITAPVPGSAYTASASVTLTADADTSYNPLASVSFYANGTFVGTVTNAPYTVTTTGLGAGTNALTAMATDGSGLSSTSAPVSINVNARSGAPYGMTTNTPVAAFLNMPTTSGGLLPPLLSETGAFSDTPNRIAASGLIPYNPNVPLWSDGAVKSRYMAVPNNGGATTPDEQITFLPTNFWTFPAGTVFVKNFDLVVNQTNLSVPLRRLETRLLVRDINGAVYGVTYKWRPDNSDADLLTTSSNEVIQVTNSTGVTAQTWYYPSPSDCLVCHTPVANYVLGLSTRQLNNNQTYPATGNTDNQLRTLNRLGLFNPAFDEATISNFEALSALTNLSASFEQRARSYLDANCAQCHQPGGTGITFDARYETPLTHQNITNFPAAFPLGFDNACVVKPADVWRSMIWQRMNTTNGAIKMPNLARSLIDSNAVAVMAGWINSLPGTAALAPPTIVPNGGIFTSRVGVTLLPPDPNAAIYYTVDGSLPTTNSFLYSGTFNLTSNATVAANAFEANSNNSVAASALFVVLPMNFTSEGFLPNQQFQMGFAGVIGSNYVLEASTNLFDWTPISTNMAATNFFNLLDPNATNFPRRFYRVREQ